MHPIGRLDLLEFVPDDVHAFTVTFLVGSFQVVVEKRIFGLHDLAVLGARIVVHTEEVVDCANILPGPYHRIHRFLEEGETLTGGDGEHHIDFFFLFFFGQRLNQSQSRPVRRNNAVHHVIVVRIHRDTMPSQLIHIGQHRLHKGGIARRYAELQIVEQIVHPPRTRMHIALAENHFEHRLEDVEALQSLTHNDHVIRQIEIVFLLLGEQSVGDIILHVFLLEILLDEPVIGHGDLRMAADAVVFHEPVHALHTALVVLEGFHEETETLLLSF